MTADLETLVVAGYVFACELGSPRGRGRPPKTTDEELIALSVAQAAMGICSDPQFLGIVDKVLPGWFVRLPSQSQYNRRLRALTPKLVWVQQRLSGLLATGALRIADGTLVGVANYAGCAQPERVRRPRRLRLLPFQEPLLLGSSARPSDRPARPAGRLHARPGEREGVRARA